MPAKIAVFSQKRAMARLHFVPLVFHFVPMCSVCPSPPVLLSLHIVCNFYSAHLCCQTERNNQKHMKKFVMFITVAVGLMQTSCNKKLLEYESDDVRVEIAEGEEWLHDFPLFLGIKKKNPPQIAIWIEDSSGRYVSTIYVSQKIATEGWLSANGNRRKEALPCWCHSRGIRYDDGLFCPTKQQPVTDALTGATPRKGFSMYFREKTGLQRFRVLVEVNHSTDFTDVYAKDAVPSSPYYSGGKEGSGQPALVYMADVDLSTQSRSFTASLIGHSSPNGSDGGIYTDMEGIDSALRIVKQITVKLK